jgi:hypothetical protein
MRRLLDKRFHFLINVQVILYKYICESAKRLIWSMKGRRIYEGSDIC